MKGDRLQEGEKKTSVKKRWILWLYSCKKGEKIPPTSTKTYLTEKDTFARIISGSLHAGQVYVVRGII